jgi:hypothetical protein
MQPQKARIAREYFSTTQEKLKNKKSPTLQKYKTSFQRTVQTLTDITSIIDIFGQSIRKLATPHLRTDKRASGNKQDSERSARLSDEAMLNYIRLGKGYALKDVFS